jgi:hypothetical protein
MQQFLKYHSRRAGVRIFLGFYALLLILVGYLFLICLSIYLEPDQQT